MNICSLVLGLSPCKLISQSGDCLRFNGPKFSTHLIWSHFRENGPGIQKERKSGGVLEGLLGREPKLVLSAMPGNLKRGSENN